MSELQAEQLRGKLVASNHATNRARTQTDAEDLAFRAWRLRVSHDVNMRITDSITPECPMGQFHCY